MSLLLLTACYIKVAGLFIQRKESQVHGAEACEGDADAVEDITIREDADIEVGCQNVVKCSNLLIPKESVRHPNFTGISHGQIFDFF